MYLNININFLCKYLISFCFKQEKYNLLFRFRNKFNPESKTSTNVCIKNYLFV